MADSGSLVEDDVLRLVLMCAHPALAPEAAGALSLRLVLGVPTTDIARLFLVPEPTMAARITRAKKRIVGAGIPFAVPDAAVLPDRLDIVAQTAYLAFTAGYAPGTGPDLLRADLSGEAIRLVRVVLGLRPDEPALVALLALMLLQHSRRDARVRDGRLVLLADQDRAALAPRRDRRGDPAAGGTGAHRPGHPAHGVVRPPGADRGRARHRTELRTTPGGTASSGSTTCCCRCRPPRPPGWRARSPSRRTAARPPGSRRSRGWRSRRATVPPRSAPSCSPARATPTPRGRRTTRRSRRAATTSSGSSSSAQRAALSS